MMDGEGTRKGREQEREENKKGKERNNKESCGCLATRICQEENAILLILTENFPRYQICMLPDSHVPNSPFSHTSPFLTDEGGHRLAL